MLPHLLESILELFPLDSYVARPIALMEVARGDDYSPEIWKDYNRIIEAAGEQNVGIDYLERHSFYERSKKAYSIIATSEKSLYANIILKKGIIP